MYTVDSMSPADDPSPHLTSFASILKSSLMEGSLSPIASEPETTLRPLDTASIINPITQPDLTTALYSN